MIQESIFKASKHLSYFMTRCKPYSDHEFIETPEVS